MFQIRRALVLPAALLCCVLIPVTCMGADSSAYRSVDPLIGTSNTGQTFPAVGPPFAMTHWTPQTRDGEAKCDCPYYFKETRIQGFRGTHFWSGSCTQDYGSVTVMPLTGDLKVVPVERASSFDRATEKASPAKYSVDLKDYGIHAEVTGTTRAGFLRFTYRASNRSWIVVNPNQRIGTTQIEIRPEQREISGYNPVHRIYQGSGKPAGFNGWFIVRFDKPVKTFGTWNGIAMQEGSRMAGGEKGSPAAWVGFETREGEVVHVKIGTSFTSLEEARRNLDAEIPGIDFEGVAAATQAAWEKSLGSIAVRGGSDEQRTLFYTSMYHALMMPRTFSDVSGSYPEFAGGRRIQRADGFTYYCDFSLWDTFRAQHPLLLLIERPARISDMVRSLVAKAEQGGWLPIFPGWNSYTSAMVGDHAISMIADAWVKGIRGFDAEKAYAFMKQNATKSPASHDEYLDGKGRRALEIYLKLGFVPLEEPVLEAFHKGEQVSRTLEYAYDDFALAQMAAALGKQADAAEFLRRAQNYRNVFDPSVGFVRGRHADGSWVAEFDPAKEQKWITEGTPWHYTWFVPQDVAGLISLMGGREKFVAKLDTVFEKNLHWHGNEPSHHIAYLYDYAGAPWKTQNHVRNVLKKEYGPGPAGLSGNDDTGQMSAWYVFTALGFYPVCPGRPEYAIGSPIFGEAVMSLGNGRKFTVRAEQNSDTNRYIQSARLNGKVHDRPWLSHDEVAKGGILELRMGPQPNPGWGSAVQAAPASLSR